MASSISDTGNTVSPARCTSRRARSTLPGGTCRVAHDRSGPTIEQPASSTIHEISMAMMLHFDQFVDHVQSPRSSNESLCSLQGELKDQLLHTPACARGLATDTGPAHRSAAWLLLKVLGGGD
jgi:hypothetical protein